MEHRGDRPRTGGPARDSARAPRHRLAAEPRAPRPEAESGEREPARPTPVTVLWIERNPHDVELAELVLARLAPQFELVGIAHRGRLSEDVMRRDFDLVVVGDVEEDQRSVAAAVGRILPGVGVVLFAELDAELGLAMVRSGFDDFLPKSSRTFLELPRFLDRAVGRGEERVRSLRRETRLSRLLDHCSIGAFRAQTDGKLLDANSAFLRMFGLADVDAARHTNLDRLLRPRSDDLDGTPLREDRKIAIRGRHQWMRLTRVLMIGAEGELILDGLAEIVEGPVRPPPGASGARDRGEGEAAGRSESAQVTAGSGDRGEVPPAEAPAPELDAPSPPPAAPHHVAPSRATAAGHPEDREPEETARQVETSGHDRGVDLDTVVHGVLDALTEPIERTQSVIDLGPLPTVQGNAEQLEILFHNLVENAIRFRSDAPPRIHVRARSHRGEVVVSVRDNGIGMSVNELRQAFEETSASFEDPTRWSPLGLAIARRIVEHHGGRLWADSHPGRGTTFFVALPTPDTSCGGLAGT